MTVFEVLQDQMKTKEEALRSALAMNTMSSMEDYRYVTGQLRGLAVARNMVKDLETSQYESDDDE